jgi:hypothetical protein
LIVVNFFSEAGTVPAKDKQIYISKLIDLFDRCFSILLFFYS